jgi:hypothetical protein
MARKTPSRNRKPAASVEAELRALFAQPLDDAALRSRLDDLAEEAAFAPMVPFWGPVLYRRNRIVFVPFILEHFPHPWNRVAWSAAPSTLGEWLEEVERHGDFELFRRLYSWKITKERGFPDMERWWADLRQAFTAAASWQERTQVLAKYDLGLGLWEEWAIELYEQDPATTRPYLLRHSIQPRGNWSPEVSRRPAGGLLPQRLLESARQHHDDDFYFALYRRYVPPEEWQADAVRLCSTIADPEQLLKSLEDRHPEAGNVVPCFHELLLERGRDVIPYVLKHLRSVGENMGQAGASWLLGLARKFGWDDLYGNLLRVCCGPEKFNQEIARLLDNPALADEDLFHRLRMLAGAAREWPSARGGGARIHPLTEANALRLYQRFPELLHGPFRQHVTRQTWMTRQGELLTAALANGDEPLLDDLAAKGIVRARRPPSAPRRGNDSQKQSPPQPTALDRLTSYYEQYRSDSRQFALRAAAVLGRLPAEAIGRRYTRVVRTNPLARLFFEDTVADFAAALELLRDLLEAVEINVQAVALRVLARDHPRTREAATEHLDLLLPLLFKPLTRRRRLWALRALLHAASTPEKARLIHDRARQALVLPVRGSPREQLIDLLGQLLHRWPELRRPHENPVIHARR